MKKNSTESFPKAIIRELLNKMIMKKVIMHKIAELMAKNVDNIEI